MIRQFSLIQLPQCHVHLGDADVAPFEPRFHAARREPRHVQQIADQRG
jgi:hypothetical protein